ncbi:MAG: ATP-binding protein [Pseudohongiellaceae bacterium]
MANRTLSGMESLLGSERSSAARQGLQRILALRTLVLITSLGTAAVFAVLDLLAVPAALLIFAPALIALSIGFGVWRLRSSQLISSHELFIQLMMDAAFLAMVLYYSGGITNPLISYLLVLLAVAATLLPQLMVNAYALLTTALYTLFLVLDLRSEASHLNHDSSFQLHLVGMWVTFVVSAILITFFITRMARTIRQREVTLAQVGENEMRNEQLVAIGTLAAGTAHALGTPLSTMAVLLNELDQQSEEELRSGPLKGDIRLLREQVTRCRDSLQSLTRFYNRADSPSGSLSLKRFMDDTRDYIVNVRPGANLEIDFPPGPDATFVSADPALKHAVINIVENSVKVARRQVRITISVDADSDTPLRIAIIDDGPGIPPEVMENMGEPFISTHKDSMGLGIFLANAAVRRCGGSIQMFNLRQGGATTLILLPLTDAEPQQEQEQEQEQNHE